MSYAAITDGLVAPAAPAAAAVAATSYELKDVLVRVANVTLSFGEKLILKPTSVEVRDVVRPGMTQGQVVGILGPSGVGKTIFSRILSGLQKPSTGAVYIADSQVPAAAPLRPVEPGRVGMVAQSYPLFRHRTVLGNLLVALEHAPLSGKDRKAKALSYLDTFELSDKADRYPAELSGGQRQRVAIIRELLCSEHFLVMDEPFTGLDPIMKEAVCELINKVALLDERNTIFVVAHDIGALVQIADQLWLFGRERDEARRPLPGATIRLKYDLMERGLAWRPGISSTREFADFVNEVREEFRNL